MSHQNAIKVQKKRAERILKAGNLPQAKKAFLSYAKHVLMINKPG